VSGVVFCSSSRWTAIEKRRQNAGSRTFAIARGGRMDRETLKVLIQCSQYRERRNLMASVGRKFSRSLEMALEVQRFLLLYS